ncbi:MAG TPA: ABC transporter substrate-binding protein [Chitinophagales bacterium]|nr:ABC transporter substrate-binding protein [Chitinophagales bacterium]
MSIKKILYIVLFLFLAWFIFGTFHFYGGSKNKVYKDQVVIHNLSDPKGINPLTVSDAVTNNYIAPYIFQTLINFDYKTLELVPVLATEVPKVLEKGNLLEVTFNIRPEATWNNGSPITAKDVAFSIKAVMAPKANTVHIQSACDFIKSIITYPEDSRKITFICDRYMELLTAFPYEIEILPEYIFDPKNILRKYSFEQLKNATEQTKNAKDIDEFVKLFNSDKAARDETMMQGSGAYKLAAFQTGQRVILERKKDWWGDKMNKINHHFEMYPKRLIYEVINDFNTAFTALKNEQLDFMYSTPIKPYIDLDNSSKFTKNFIKSNPVMFGYQCIGMNHKDPILKDQNVRLALAYLTNIDQMIEKVFYNMAERTVASIQPHTEYYNDTIKPYPFDPKKAGQLLKDAGWADTDDDGILDKVIDGKKIKFELKYCYNSGNPIREMIGLLIQKSYKQAGVNIIVQPLDWSLYLNELQKHNVQLWYQGWVAAPGLSDDKQIYHTSSAIDGSNYMSYGNATTDKLLDEIRLEMDKNKRIELVKKWQLIQHEELPYIYLYVQKYRNIIHKRFKGVIESSVYPGIWFGTLQVKDGYKVEK